MLLSQNLRKGTIFVLNNAPCLVLDYTHIKLARSDAIIKVKIKNLKTGVIKEESFKSSERVKEADVENKELQFLYKEGNGAIFMDSKTYEQHSYNLGDHINQSLLKEGESYQLNLFEGALVNIIFPKNMDLKVVYTEPGFKGDTSSSVLKPARLENGMQINVPLFINIGDVVKINTETEEYRERVSKS